MNIYVLQTYEFGVGWLVRDVFFTLEEAKAAAAGETWIEASIELWGVTRRTWSGEQNAIMEVVKL